MLILLPRHNCGMWSRVQSLVSSHPWHHWWHAKSLLLLNDRLHQLRHVVVRRPIIHWFHHQFCRVLRVGQIPSCTCCCFGFFTRYLGHFGSLFAAWGFCSAIFWFFGVCQWNNMHASQFQVSCRLCCFPSRSAYDKKNIRDCCTCVSFKLQCTITRFKGLYQFTYLSSIVYLIYHSLSFCNNTQHFVTIF